MIAPELLEQLQQLNRSDKLRVLQYLSAELVQEEEEVEQTRGIEQHIQDIFQEYRPLFEKLAKGEE